MKSGNLQVMVKIDVCDSGTTHVHVSVCGNVCLCVSIARWPTTDQTTREVFQLKSVSVHEHRSRLALEEGEKLLDRQCWGDRHKATSVTTQKYTVG